MKNPTKHINTINAEISHFMKTILIREDESAVDLLTFIESPFIDRKNNDLISKIYNKFMQLKGSPAVPIFYTFAILSHWNSLNNVRFKVPNSYKFYKPNLWIMAVAPSGAGKSKNIDMINDMLPQENGSPVIEGNFKRPASLASMVTQLAKNPIAFWPQDEAAEWLKSVENSGHPLSECRDPLLKAKGGEKITYHTKTDGEKVIKDTAMTIFFSNTIWAMQQTLSENSMRDGLFSRFITIVAEQMGEGGRIHHDNIIPESGLDEDFKRILSQNTSNVVYTFTEECQVVWGKVCDIWAENVFSNMQGNDNWMQPFYERITFEAYKFAILHHQFHCKKGYEVQVESMQWALRITAFNLKSLLRFFFLRDTKKQNAIAKAEIKEQQIMEKVKEFIRTSENNNGFGSRAVLRKFHLSKPELIELLMNIKKTDNKFKTSLYELLK